jgi:hypothetical protein
VGTVKGTFLKVCVLIFLITAAVFIIGAKCYAAAVPVYKLIKTMEEDTTGDGIKEKIKILADEKNKGYVVEVVGRDGKTYSLKPGVKFPFVGTYTPFWGLKVIVADINGDKVPEITIVGSGTHEVPLNIFRWDGSSYKNVFSNWTYGTMGFKDITGDDIPELIVNNRLYGSGSESIYYKWEGGRYRKIYYEVDAARGYEGIKIVLEMMGNGAFPYSEDIPDRDRMLRNYFTQEWIDNKNNIKYLKEFNEGMLSIQITDTIGINSKLDPNEPGKPLGEIWKFRVKIFKVRDSKLYPENLTMEVFIKPIAEYGENRWRIDSIKFYPQ